MSTTPVLVPVPPVLASWLQEHGFSGCAWYLAQPAVTTRKIVGTDAWRFGQVVLSRVPVGTDELRYYATTDPEQVAGQTPASAAVAMVGYWLEVRRLPSSPSRAGIDSPPLPEA
jgi:hypothetical protein